MGAVDELGLFGAPKGRITQRLPGGQSVGGDEVIGVSKYAQLKK